LIAAAITTRPSETAAVSATPVAGSVPPAGFVAGFGFASPEPWTATARLQEPAMFPFEAYRLGPPVWQAKPM
jgi:hypothetical protein